jgi:DNA-binding response OmpR family regulator
MAEQILIVDDESLLRRTLAFNLEQAGYRTSAAANAEDALAIILRDPPDLILLDIALPGMDGLEAIQHFQQRTGAPIIFLTARGRKVDQVVGLELGADDYITKPFDLTVLMARIKAVLRRAQTMTDLSTETTQLEIGDLVINPGTYQVTLKGAPLALSPREFDLLYALALGQGQVISVNDLLAQVWGAEYAGEPQVVYVHIRWLRNKLEEDPQNPQRIITVRGKGYRLVSQEA